MVQTKIATYISDSGVSTELRTELQHIFDTYQVFPEVPAQVGYISRSRFYMGTRSWSNGHLESPSFVDCTTECVLLQTYHHFRCTDCA